MHNTTLRMTTTKAYDYRPKVAQHSFPWAVMVRSFATAPPPRTVFASQVFHKFFVKEPAKNTYVSKLVKPLLRSWRALDGTTPGDPHWKKKVKGVGFGLETNYKGE